jgi:hypothetical protein
MTRPKLQGFPQNNFHTFSLLSPKSTLSEKFNLLNGNKHLLREAFIVKKNT